MNCKMLFLKRAKPSELLIVLSKLFHSITVNGKNNFFLKKKVCYDIEPRNVVFIISYSICCPIGEDFIKQIFRELILSCLKEIVKFSNPTRCFKDSKPNS